MRGFSSKVKLLHPPEFFTFNISPADSDFWLFLWEKIRIGINSHTFQRQLEQLQVQLCTPHTSEWEINPWKSWPRTKERSFALFSQEILCQSPPGDTELQLPVGTAGLGLEGNRICESGAVNTGKTKLKTELAEITGLELPQKSQTGWDRQDWGMGNEHLGVQKLWEETPRALLFGMITFNSGLCFFPFHKRWV